MLVSTDLLQSLEEDWLGRRVVEGFSLLEGTMEEAANLKPEDPHATGYLLNVAQWVDLGYRDLELLKRLIEGFSSVSRSEMRLVDYIRLNMTEAFVAFASEDHGAAISILERVLVLQQEVVEPGMVAVLHFWKGRAHRKKGEYELALHHILLAKSAAQQLQAPKLAAVIQTHESWLLFQRGQRKEAIRLLDEAEQELQSTNHALALGNIESARGRFVRRSGEYAKALKHFDHAIEIYSEQFPNHPNLARALVNASYVKRLIALDLSHRSKEGRARGAQHAKCLQICQEALELLERARVIYTQHQHQSGIGSVLVNAGHLHLESGDIERASQEAVKAFHLGQQKEDHILMARSRILQSALENVQVEEQLGEPEDIASHANMAAQYSNEAIGLAKQTQNRRLLAGAYIARGITAANDFFEEWETAKQFASMASELLSPDDRDHLSKELLALKSRILRATGIDHTLRAWSDGQTGDKTFQQISEEFAELVIQRVWVKEGRKISRVADRLSISPKKVRRIVRNLRVPD